MIYFEQQNPFIRFGGKSQETRTVTQETDTPTKPAHLSVAGKNLFFLVDADSFA
jgi:hypothetical protein